MSQSDYSESYLILTVFTALSLVGEVVIVGICFLRIRKSKEIYNYYNFQLVAMICIADFILSFANLI